MKPKGHKRNCRCVVCARENHGYENQANTLHEKAARDATAIGNPRKKKARKKKRNSTVRPSMGPMRKGYQVAGNPTSADNHELKQQLLDFAFNDGGLYNMMQSVRKNLVNKMAAGKYSYPLSKKAWEHVANRAAQEFHRQSPKHVTTGWQRHGSYGAFTPQSRKLAAVTMADWFRDEAQTGAYDYLLFKKYKGKRNLPAKQNKGHYPRTGRGPKGNATWFIFDLFDSKGVRTSTRIKRITKAAAHTEAAGLVDRKVGSKIVRKVELAGPYSRKPTPKTVRK